MLGTLISDQDLDETPPLETDCGECRICIDACPTGALDEPGTLDATKCLSYPWTQAPSAIPEEYRTALGAQVYGCDICQDVCPWNRGVEKRRAGRQQVDEGHVDLVEWLESETLVTDFDRLYVPRNDPSFLRRNALVALGNVGGPEHVAVLEQHAEDEHARWAIDRIGERAKLGSSPS